LPPIGTTISTTVSVRRAMVFAVASSTMLV